MLSHAASGVRCIRKTTGNRNTKLVQLKHFPNVLSTIWIKLRSDRAERNILSNRILVEEPAKISLTGLFIVRATVQKGGVMCGIIGFCGSLPASEVLMAGLKQLEYRGYDSAGIAVRSEDGIHVRKAIGNVSRLEEKLGTETFSSGCGIGHTRWATHGGVSEENAHPHRAGRVTLIHNGIIENYKEIWEMYGAGRTLVSQTDTEIAATLFDALYEEGKPEEAIGKAVAKLEGSYAFCILFEDIPDTIYCIRKVSPLVAARAEEGSFVASDVTALITYTQEYFVLPEDTILILKKGEMCLKDLEGNKVEPELLHVDWDTTAAQKNGYPHYMIKEIHEQPEALHNTIAPRMKDGMPDFEVDQIPDSIFKNIHQVKIVACGTAMHAGLVGKVLMEKRVRIPVTVEIASEFRYQNPIIDERTLVIVISQSGETIDTLASLRLAKSEGAYTLGIVNVKGSTIARESDYVLYTHAGPEIAVASTKAYTVQLAAMVMLSVRMAYVRGMRELDKIKQDYEALKQAAEAVYASLALEEEIEKLTHALTDKEDLFFIGRGIDYALSCEGSIKLKEISYIHSEAYAAGELKHGTISLITEGVPVIAIATQKEVYAKMISNIREVKARGALVILITQEDTPAEASLYDYHLTVPKLPDEFTPIPAAVILQLIAYYTSVHKGLNVDQPRNLAKSVTVE